MKIHTIQAHHGDCFILEFGKRSKKKFILIDGGPRGVYKKYLRSNLKKISKKRGKLDLIILSHVDQDHILGLLDLMKELKRKKPKKPIIKVKELWQNTFGLTLDSKNNIIPKLSSISTLSKSKSELTNTKIAAKSIPQGNDLKILSKKLHLPSNKIFKNGIITVENHPKTIRMQDIRITIVGPTIKNLKRLRREWLKYLKKQRKKLLGKNKKLAKKADNSIPNLSSIMFLIKTRRKSILFTGDGRGDHIIQGLKLQKLLKPNGKLHVDLLKMPHHGSDRNVNPSFFKTITADGYIISGKNHGRTINPDLTTLKWIVESAKQDKRKITIYVTNKTPNTKKLLKQRPKSEYGYNLKIMPKRKKSFTLELR